MNELEPTSTLDEPEIIDKKCDRINIVQDDGKFAEIDDDKEEGPEPVGAVGHSKKNFLGQRAAKSAKNLNKAHDANDMVVWTAISYLIDESWETSPKTIAAS